MVMVMIVLFAYYGLRTGMLRVVSKDDLSTGNVYDSALPWLSVPEMCAFMVIVITAFLHIMASGQVEVVLREESKDDLSTGNVYDSAWPWLTVPEKCASMVIVITALLAYYGLRTGRICVTSVVEE